MQEQNGEENEVSLETIFRQLLLDDGNNDPSPPLLALSSSENPVVLPVLLRTQGQ
jgi:hypothetical protein